MVLESRPAVKSTKVLMPIVLRKIEKINAAFTNVVGPIGVELADETLLKWIHAGRVRPSDLRYYVIALAAFVDSSVERERFIDAAEKLLLQL